MSGATNRLLATARRVHPDPPGEELDRLLATGESQTSTLLAIALQQKGVRARSFSGSEAGIVTDDCFGHARILEIQRNRITASLAAGEVPVVTGFQGVTADGRITTLGRGGSDITAVALAVAHAADRVVLYRDVQGIHSADPKLLAISYRIDHLDYDNMIDLAEAGVPIVHPQALETARAHQILLEVRGIANNSAYTRISSEGCPPPMPVWSISLSHPVSILTLDSLPNDVRMLSRVMELLDRTDLELEGEFQPAETRGVCLSVQLPDHEGPPLREQMEDYLREENGIRFSLERRRRRVTLVGRGVGSRRVSKAVEQVAARLGPPMATFWGEHHRAFVVPEREGRGWLASLHQELIQP
jgi:aspartate kinase